MKKSMLILSILVFSCSVISSFTYPQNETSKVSNKYTPQQVEKGKYLVEIMGCRDCHSPKVMTAQVQLLICQKTFQDIQPQCLLVKSTKNHSKNGFFSI